MSLVKKTVVLSDRTPKGYLTVVRVGNETGLKIVGETFVKGMVCYVKIGRETFTRTLVGKRTETDSDSLLLPDSTVGCMVFDGEKIVAFGGKITEGEVEAYRREKEEKQAILPVEEEETEENTAEETAEAGEPESDVTEENKTEAGESTGETSLGSEEEEMLRRIGEGTDNFYVGISDRVDELFVVYPKEEKLSATLPDSEWVKVKYDGEDYYVVGRLSDEGKVRYLGYGVPGFENLKPPKAADGIANWFPVEGLDGFDGYWLFFQDATTGKIDS